jgi:hypothetical protein
MSAGLTQLIRYLALMTLIKNLGRRTWPIPTSVRPPFLECEDDATLSTCGRCHLQGRAIRPRGRPQAREEVEERDHSRERSLESKKATTSGGGRRDPTMTPPEEKEDTVGSVTMINSHA